MNTDTYFTIEAPSEGAYKEKGSKFIAYAYSVSCEDEIKELIQGLKKLYYDARHHCYAWQLGVEGLEYRVNDDGEPSGTAGKPIHGQIKSHQLTNILIVVVRYFGGTKLGTSGLITAYREAALDAINNALIIEKTVNDIYQVDFDYGVMNDVMRIIKEEEPQIVKQEFDLHCMFQLSIRQSSLASLLGRLEKIESVRLAFLTSS